MLNKMTATLKQNKTDDNQANLDEFINEGLDEIIGFVKSNEMPTPESIQAVTVMALLLNTINSINQTRQLQRIATALEAKTSTDTVETVKLAIKNKEIELPVTQNTTME